MSMLSKLQKEEIINKIAEKFESLRDGINSKNYFDDYDNQKELILDVTSYYIDNDPKIIFAELNENKQLEIAPTTELIAKHGEKGASVIAQKRAENYIIEVIGLIKEILEESEKEENKNNATKKYEKNDKKVNLNKSKLTKLNKAGNYIYEEIILTILKFAKYSEKFTMNDLLPELEENFGDVYSKNTLHVYGLKALKYCQKNDWVLELEKRKNGAYIFTGGNIEEGLVEMKKE